MTGKETEQLAGAARRGRKAAKRATQKFAMRQSGLKRKPAAGAGKPKRATGKTAPPTAAGSTPKPASKLIDQRIKELSDWRGKTLLKVRQVIKDADKDIIEEWKWEIPVWSHNGIICTGETYKNVVKLTFAKGASLKDPASLFNSSLEGKVRRAIDIREGEQINEAALKELVRAAVAVNLKSKGSQTAATPKLLSGGNPQIAKAAGDAPVQAYIAAVPGWKRDIARRLDALIVKTVPGVRKAVKWNSPFYGFEEQGWFVSFHVFTRYIKVTFFRGTSLRPSPPGGTAKEARWIDIHEDDFDNTRLTTWIKQAAAIPGWGG